MAANHIPRRPAGYVKGKELTDTNEPFGLKIGLITRVDELNYKADIKVLTGGGERFEIDLTQAMAGPRSFWGGVPELNSLVILGYRRRHKQLYEAMILGYIPVGNRLGLKFDPLAYDDPSSIDPADQDLFNQVFGPQVRYKRLKLSPGDVGGMSASGSEFTLTKDVRMINRAGDLFELRDADRTLVAQSIHRVESEAGVFRISGPIRRSGLFLPPDIFRSDGVTLKDAPDPERYFGRTILKRFTTDGATVINAINDTTTYPPVTYSNGRRAFYVSSTPGVDFEDIDTGAGAEPFTEWRMEIAHTTDCTQEVREEIDGFQMDRRPVFIEHVLGTLVGNDTSTDTGLQQYGQLLRPKLFDDFEGAKKGTFALEAVPRPPTDDIEAYTTAGAYLLRINPPPTTGPAGTADDISSFAVAVSKQGKLFVNIPGSRVERYAGPTKNVSAEVNMDGALKMRLGASTPDGIALYLTLEGGAIFDFRGGASGVGLQFRTHSSVKWETQGSPDTDDVAWEENIQGVKNTFCSGDNIQNVAGAKSTTVNGAYGVLADRYSLNAHSGTGINTGGWDFVSSGKSQYQYAQQVQETIVAGGRLTTILAGGQVETLAAGARSISVLGGAMSTNVAAGAYSVTAGAGAITLAATAGAVITTAGAAISTTAVGAITMTAGLAINLVSPVSVSLVTLQVLLGGPAAVLGVCRGLPILPPGTPSLDYITGLPLMGGAMVRSI